MKHWQKRLEPLLMSKRVHCVISMYFVWLKKVSITHCNHFMDHQKITKSVLLCSSSIDARQFHQRIKVSQETECNYNTFQKLLSLCVRWWQLNFQLRANLFPTYYPIVAGLNKPQSTDKELAEHENYRNFRWGTVSEPSMEVDEISMPGSLSTEWCLWSDVAHSRVEVLFLVRNN